MKIGLNLLQVWRQIPRQPGCWRGRWMSAQALLQTYRPQLAVYFVTMFAAVSSGLTPTLAQELGEAGVPDALRSAVSGGAATDAGPQALLERMAQAQREVEYEGTLVYLHGHHLATLRIAHRIDNGVAMESLLALSGPIRAVARNQRGVTCMSSDAHAFSLPRGEQGGAVLRSAPVDLKRLRRHYAILVLGQSRIAGRDTDVVGIAPRDDLRYGHRYFIDRKTGLPLKMDLLDHADLPIEQVMFTNVEIFPADSGPALLSATPLNDAPVDDEQVAIVRDSGWTLTAMPPGFEIVASRRDQAMEHLVIGDGIASVSVYIEPDVDGLVGATRMGAIVAIGGRLDGHHATVVGEVPERTARMLLDGLTAPRSAAAER